MAAVKKKTVFEVQAKERKLIVLPDQGAAVKISTQLFDLQSRDRSWNPFIESFVRASGLALASTVPGHRVNLLSVETKLTSALSTGHD